MQVAYYKQNVEILNCLLVSLHFLSAFSVLECKSGSVLSNPVWKGLLLVDLVIQGRLSVGNGEM